MGGGVAQSLVRAGFPTVVRDLRPAAQEAAVRRGASPAASPADLARRCDVVIILVVDALEVETVLFGADGAASALIPQSVVVASSTVDPVHPPQWALRVARCGAALLDAPISGGPARAAAGTMTMMVSGDASAQERAQPVLAAISGRLFPLGPRAGDASAFKIVNNLLAAANLAAGAEALALAQSMRLDLALVAEVIGASSGGSWIFADRVPRALAGDFAPRAAARILGKDIGIAVALAQRCGVDATFARAAQAALTAAVAGGDGDADDAILVRRALERARAMPRAE
jgi:3-hydroxyisobutyrate dehydrogenase-like beta-hydroxyacid dehydrogenase